MRSYSKTPSSLMYEISTGTARTRSPPRVLIALINAHGNVSSIPKSRPIRFFRMLEVYPARQRNNRAAGAHRHVASGGSDDPAPARGINSEKHYVPRLRRLALLFARPAHGVPLVRQVRAAGDDLPD